MNQTRRFQLLYLVYFASFSGFAAFRNVYLDELGMSGFEMGVVGSLSVAGGVVAQPAWGVVADRTGLPARILVVAAACSGVAVLFYPASALFPATFAVVVVGTLLYSATRAPIVPIANSLILAADYQYGQIRSLGSVAFGVGVLAIGSLLAFYDTALIVYVYVAGMSAFALLALGLPGERGSFSGSLGTGAIGLARDRAFALLLVVGFLMGFASASGTAFFSVYMRAIGLGDGLTGAALAIKTVAEAGVFLALARRGTNYRRQLALAAVLYAVTYVTFASTEAAAVILGVELLLGAGYALFYYSLVNAVHAVAPETLQSTAQTLLAGVGIGTGGAVGQLLAGRLVELFGVQRLYVYLAGVVLCIVAVVGLLDAGSADAAPVE